MHSQMFTHIISDAVYVKKNVFFLVSLIFFTDTNTPAKMYLTLAPMISTEGRRRPAPCIRARLHHRQ